MSCQQCMPNVQELCVFSMDKSREHKKTTGLGVMICEIRLLWRCLIPEALNPLSPHDALKYHFTSLKTDLIYLQPKVLE